MLIVIQISLVIAAVVIGYTGKKQWSNPTYRISEYNDLAVQLNTDSEIDMNTQRELMK